MSTDQDPVDQFLRNADKISQEARFIISSFPNAETQTVERAIRQLYAINSILANLTDDFLTSEEIDGYQDFITSLLVPLEEFLAADPLPRNVGTSTEPSTGRQGRPRYALDLQRAIELHDLGNSWEDVAGALGVSRRTLYDHLEKAGLSTSRKAFTDIDDDDLDIVVSEISLKHPLAGASIIQGHLEGAGIHVPILRVKECLRRVDAIGVMLRYVLMKVANQLKTMLTPDGLPPFPSWSSTIRRRVYRVRGSNALWHHDGNEKLKPWGFYVHGCVDGHSRMIIYLVCSNNKRSATVAQCFKQGVEVYGWPSRVRGDYGSENNIVERWMIDKRGQLHRAYLRGR